MLTMLLLTIWAECIAEEKSWMMVDSNQKNQNSCFRHQHARILREWKGSNLVILSKDHFHLVKVTQNMLSSWQLRRVLFLHKMLRPEQWNLVTTLPFLKGDALHQQSYQDFLLIVRNLHSLLQDNVLERPLHTRKYARHWSHQNVLLYLATIKTLSHAAHMAPHLLVPTNHSHNQIQRGAHQMFPCHMTRIGVINNIQWLLTDTYTKLWFILFLPTTSQSATELLRLPPSTANHGSLAYHTSSFK